jgi:hypothetical protein
VGWQAIPSSSTVDFDNVVTYPGGDADFLTGELVVPGKVSYGASSYDNKTAILFYYPFSESVDVYVRSISSSLVDYTTFHDEMREHPQIPGLYIGVLSVNPSTWINFTDEPLEVLKYALMQVEEVMDYEEVQVKEVQVEGVKVEERLQGTDLEPSMEEMSMGGGMFRMSGGVIQGN